VTSPPARRGGAGASTGRARRGNQPRSGRRAGDSGTRTAILEAARRQFAANGYDSATIRAIAADAGVDPALVHHFHGSKERLFAAAMQLPVVPSEVIAAALADGSRPPGVSVGEHIARSALTLWEAPGVREAFQGLLKSAVTSEQAAAMLREFLTEAILGPVASLAGQADPGGASFRASLVATQMLGLAMARYLLKFGPVATASHDELVAAIGPAIDRYLTGALDDS
jgi:AcrR family transcriptional regulator